MYQYQRSSDSLLGTQHNWIQYWGLLVYLAHVCGYTVGTLTWKFGDLHLYNEESHIQCANEILDGFSSDHLTVPYNLTYQSNPENLFKPELFSLETSLNWQCAPLTQIRPKLL